MFDMTNINSNFRKLADDIGKVELAKFLGVSSTMIHKSIRHGACPCSWFHKLVGISDFVYEDFYEDHYSNKAGISLGLAEDHILSFNENYKK